MKKLLNTKPFCHFIIFFCFAIWGQIFVIYSNALAQNPAPIIGYVSQIKGDAWSVNSFSGKIKLLQDSPIYQQETLTTSNNSALKITFVDDTILTLSGDAYIMIDQMVYDPDTQTGKISLSLIRGAVLFISGKIAKKTPKNMMVNVAGVIIGVRGTAVIAKTNPDSTKEISLLDGIIDLTIPNSNNGNTMISMDQMFAVANIQDEQSNMPVSLSISSHDKMMESNSNLLAQLNNDELNLLQTMMNDTSEYDNSYFSNIPTILTLVISVLSLAIILYFIVLVKKKHFNLLDYLIHHERK